MAASDWNISEPIDHTKIRDLPQKIRDVHSATKHIILKEHVQPSTSGAGGQHLLGSTRVYLQSSAPTTDPEANNLATSDTSDNGRIVVLTGSNNLAKVYVQTSAGISTGWQGIAVERVSAATSVQMNGYRVEGIGTGTQSGQLIHVGQIDTGMLHLYQPATSGSLRVKLSAIGGAPATSYIAKSGNDGLVVLYSQDSNAVDGYHVAKYDSGWFAANAATNYTKAHGLGVVPDFVSVLFSDTADGSGDVVPVGVANYSGNYSAIVIDIDDTNIVIRGHLYLADYYNSSGVRQMSNSGYLKITALSVS